MRKALAVSLLLSTFALAAAPAPKLATANNNDLPVKRVVLYKNGVGYFEHKGHVRGSQELNIDFTTGQLNDVLKSLTVVDRNGGQITGVRYNSIAPLSERLGTLRLRLGEQTSRADFLNALRGARVEVRNGTVTGIGRLLSVEQTTRVVDKIVVPVTQVTIVSDGGDVRTFDLNPATTVRLAENDLNQEVGRYMSLISTARAKDLRRMTISTAGTGDREVFVSYISEVPVWKSTYRIILPKDAKEKALLQGWAIVDNTVGEDWKDVQLSLVAGSPQSFTQQISQPQYVRRPVVALPESAMLTPQSHEGTMQFDKLEMLSKLSSPPPPPPTSPATTDIGDELLYVPGAGLTQWPQQGMVSRGDRIDGTTSVSGRVTDPSGAGIANATVSVTDASGNTQSRTTDFRGNYTISGVASGQASINISSVGFQDTQARANLRSPYNQLDYRLNVGSVNSTVEVEAEPTTMDTSASLVRSYVENASSKKLGDLFEYAIKQRITVLKNQSALVPIAQANIEAEKVTLITIKPEMEDDEDLEKLVPLRALWVTNSSGLTLDGGSFNIVEDGSFGGEGMIEEIRPDEKRLISYAADTAVRITVEGDDEDRPVTRVKIAEGIMKLTSEERAKITYTVHNSDKSSRTVVIEHPVVEEWKLVDGVKPAETTASYHRFKVPVAAGETEELAVEQFHPSETTYALTNITDDQIKLWTSQRTIKPELEQAFRKLLAKKSEISGVDAQLGIRRAEIQQITQEQQRIRDNMKALKGSSEEKALTQRYVQSLNAQEDRLTTLNTEIKQLNIQRNQRNEELRTMALGITLDETL
jgi:hypothetical protein